MNRPSEETLDLLRQLRALGLPSRWLAGRRVLGRGTDLLIRIGESGSPAAIPMLVEHLVSSRSAVQVAAARGLHALLSRLTDADLARLAENAGGWHWELPLPWRMLRKANVRPVPADDPVLASVLGLLSFHRSGYVREDAVRRLAESGGGLPFLLLRLNDWVEPVAEAARAAVAARLTPEHLPDFARHLPLVVRMTRAGRRDLADLASWFVELLSVPGNEALLDQAARSSDRLALRGVMRLVLAKDRDTVRRVLPHALRSPDPAVRLWFTRKLPECLSDHPLRDALDARRRDPATPVRRQALLVAAEAFPDEERSLWREALLDPAPPVRDLARFRLRKLGVEPPPLYRESLMDAPDSLPALAGLGECGDATDLPTLRAALAHPVPSRRRAALRGLARIGGEQVLAELVAALNDPSPKTAREAADRVREHLPVADLAPVYAVARDGVWFHSRREALRLLFDAGKWWGLPWLIRASSHPDPETARLAAERFGAWFRPPACNRVFTRPSEGEALAIEEALAEAPVETAGRFREVLNRGFA